MMSATYSLPPGKAHICRLAGRLFLVCAALSLLGSVVVAVWPGPALSCLKGAPCRWTSQPARMLDQDERAKATATPAAEATLDRYVARPAVRAGILAVDLIDTGPFAVLLASLGIALRQLGGRGGRPVAAALPWLRRASLAAMIWAIGRPLNDSLMAALLSPGTPSGGHLYINVDLVDVGIALMLAVAAYAAIWALEAGLQAQRDLDEFV